MFQKPRVLIFRDSGSPDAHQTQAYVKLCHSVLICVKPPLTNLMNGHKLYTVLQCAYDHTAQQVRVSES